MVRLTAFICIVSLCVGCLPPESTDKPLPVKDHLTVFFSGNILGNLKPCGCTTGQLGGIERRGAVFNKTEKNKRLIIDTGNILTGQSEQDIIKFGILFQAMEILEYDLVNLNETDLAIARDLTLLDNPAFNLITGASDSESSIGSSFTKEMQLGREKLYLNIASADAESISNQPVRNLFAAKPNALNLNILLINNCNDDIISQITSSGIVDVVVCPTDADEPEIIHKDIKKPLFITVGRLGEYIGKLTVGLAEGNQLNVNYSRQTVTEKLQPNHDLVQLYRDYQFMVKEADLLGKIPRVPLPDGLQYVGSAKCKLCHEYEYNKWAEFRHAHAYKTLVEVNSQYDPECIGCHVVGIGYESGFISEQSPKDLRNVGCEVCHGPASRHIASEGEIKPAEPKSACIDCHTSEQDPDYERKKNEKFKKIVHWPEQ
jgi:hypothetical protein